MPITKAIRPQKTPAAAPSPAASPASALSRSSTAKTTSAVRKNCQRKRLYRSHASLRTLPMSIGATLRHARRLCHLRGPVAVQRRVEAAAGEKLVVRALLDDASVLEHDDQV